MPSETEDSSITVSRCAGWPAISSPAADARVGHPLLEEHDEPVPALIQVPGTRQARGDRLLNVVRGALEPGDRAHGFVDA